MKKLEKKYFEIKIGDFEDYTYCENEKEALAIFRDSMLRHYLPGAQLTDEKLLGCIREFKMSEYRIKKYG